MWALYTMTKMKLQEEYKPPSEVVNCSIEDDD